MEDLIKFLEYVIKDRKFFRKVILNTKEETSYLLGQQHAYQECLDRINKLLEKQKKEEAKKKT